MEWIGRRVCETKFVGARQAYDKMYGAQEIFGELLWRVIATVSVFAGIIVTGVITFVSIMDGSSELAPVLALSAAILMFGAMGLWFWLVGKYTCRNDCEIEAMRIKEFYKKFPEYDGIFEQKMD